MIESLTVTNHLGESLKMVLADPESSGLAITSIEGIGQPDAEINITEMAGSDYGSFNSARFDKRNVVIDILYYGNDIEAERIKCNRFFPTKKLVKLRFVTEYRDCYLTGYVEKNEANVFSKNAGCQISILCPDRYFYSEDMITTDFSHIEPRFFFPFCDGNEDEIEFSEYIIEKEKSLYYEGDGETGLTIELHALGAVKGFTLYNVNTNEQMGIDDASLETITGSGIIEKDTIVINTRKGQKSVTLIRDGVSTNIINALVKNPRPNWFELSAGDNLLAYTATQGEYDLILNMYHKNTYKGI